MIQVHPPPRNSPLAVPTGVSDVEVASLSRVVINSHSRRAVLLACLYRLTESAFSKSPSGLAPLISLQQECIQSYMREHGMPVGEVRSAVAALERAGSTAEYLNSLPS